MRVDVIYVLQQRMLVVLPIDAANAVRHNICAVRLVLSDHVAVLLAKLAEITAHKESLQPPYFFSSRAVKAEARDHIQPFLIQNPY